MLRGQPVRRPREGASTDAWSSRRSRC